MHSPRVGVIILNYNNAEDTLRCVQSVKASTYHSVASIVVDNGSDTLCIEHLRRRLAPMEGVTLLPLETNFGFSFGMNRGIEYARDHGAEMVVPLNNDTVLDPDCLGHMVACAHRHPNVAIVAPKIRILEEPSRLWFAGSRFGLQYPKHRGIGQIDRGQYDQSELIRFASGCAFLLTDRAMREIGILDERFFFGGEDRELSFRCLRFGLEIWYEPRAVVYHKKGASRRKIPQPERIYMGYLTQFVLLKTIRPRPVWLGWYGAYAVHFSTFFPIRLALANGLGPSFWASFRSAWSAWAFAYKGTTAYPKTAAPHAPPPRFAASSGDRPCHLSRNK